MELFDEKTTYLMLTKNSGFLGMSWKKPYLDKKYAYKGVIQENSKYLNFFSIWGKMTIWSFVYDCIASLSSVISLVNCLKIHNGTSQIEITDISLHWGDMPNVCIPKINRLFLGILYMAHYSLQNSEG